MNTSRGVATNPPAWALRAARKGAKRIADGTPKPLHLPNTVGMIADLTEMLVEVIAAEVPVTYGKDVAELVEAARRFLECPGIVCNPSKGSIHYCKKAARLQAALAKFKEEK